MSREDWEIRSALAAEYVLGTLDGAARRRFERSLELDPALRAEVARWERSLYRLADGVPPVTPPPQVWERIRAEIGADVVEQHEAVESEAVARPAPAAPGSPAREPAATAFSEFWHSVGFWRGWSFAATAASAVLAVALYLAPGAAPVTYMVVVTDDAQSRASWVISGNASSNQVRVRALAAQAIPEGRVFQLWVLPAGATSVRSVGLIPPDGDARLTVSGAVAALLADAKKFGVSVEPPGGSPTGQPTTTPLYHGTPLAL